MGASVATVNNATEIRLLAERQMGEFLKAMPKNEGAKGSVVTGSVREPVKDTTPTLADIGITKKQSHVATKPARPSVEQPDAEPSKPGPARDRRAVRGAAAAVNFFEQVSTGVSTFALWAPSSEVAGPAGIEPTSAASEATILSVEIRSRENGADFAGPPPVWQGCFGRRRKVLRRMRHGVRRGLR